MGNSFKDIDFKLINTPEFISTQDDIENLFKSLFSSSIEHSMAVAYFTSSWIRENAKGISNFLVNNGKAKWIVSPNLQNEDFDKFEDYKDKSEVEKTNIIEKIIERDIEEIVDLLESDKQIVQSLKELIESGRLEMKIAVPSQEPGLFHWKDHYFLDSESNIIKISGSGNATEAALSNNLERYFLYCNFKLDENHFTYQPHYINKNKNFDELFENKSSFNFNVHPLSDALKNKLVKKLSINNDSYIYQPNKINKDDLNENTEKFEFKIPDKFYENDNYNKIQDKAIQNSKDRNYSAILTMATGTGKTITAIKIAKKFLEDNKEKNYLFAVTCPNDILVRQWEEEFLECGIKSNYIFSINNTEAKSRTELLEKLRKFKKRPEPQVLIFPHEALNHKNIQKFFNKLSTNTFFIVDEIHRPMYQESNRKEIRDFYRNMHYKLGLTATVSRRIYNESIESPEEYEKDYFGKDSLVEIVNLKEAIYEYKILCPYNYICINYDLEFDEFKDGLELYKKIKPYNTDNSDKDDNFNSSSAIYALTNFINSVESKNSQLLSFLTKDFMSNLGKTLFFIPGSHVEKLHNHFNKNSINASHIDAKTNKENRNKILNQLDGGIIKIITSHTILDEGINVPSINNAFVTYSAREPRQGIQRRGRVLRKSAKKTIANIYDLICKVDSKFINLIPENNKSAARSFTEWLLNRESERINEFKFAAESFNEE